MHTDHKKVTYLYYGFQFFFSLLLWVPIFYEYQKRFGLIDSEIFKIQSLYYLAFCLLEFPTGLIADWLGHRRCMRAGAVTLTIANILPIFFVSYSGFLVHFLLIALARSFISGASSAYLYNYLCEHHKGKEYKMIEGNARAYSLVGKIICWAAVGYLMEWHITLPYWITSGAALISVGFAWAMPQLQAGAHDEVSIKNSLHVTKAILRILYQTPFLMLLMFQGITLFVLARICQVNLFQPILGAKTFSVQSYGVIMAVMTIFEALGSAQHAWLQKWIEDLAAIFLLSFVMAISLAVLPWCDKTTTLIALSFFAYATGLSFPIQRQVLNEAIVHSKYRATLLSIESIIDRAVTAWVAAMLGGYLSQNKLNEFLILSSAFAIGLLVIIYCVIKLFFTKNVKTQLNETVLLGHLDNT